MLRTSQINSAACMPFTARNQFHQRNLLSQAQLELCFEAMCVEFLFNQMYLFTRPMKADI